MCLSLLEMPLLLLPPLLLAIALTIHQRLPKDRWICIGRTRGDEETLVKSSNDRKLGLHIGCTSNAKEYSRCCLPIISYFFTMHSTGTCTHMYTITYTHMYTIAYKKATLPSTRVELALTHIRMWVGFNLGSTRIHQKEFSAGMRHPSWTWVQPRFKLQCGCALKV